MPERSDFRELSERIDKLERQTGVLKRLLGISLVLVFALAAGGATIAQQRALIFNNADGTVRVGGSGFALYDKAGHRRLSLGWNSASQPGVYFSDASGTTRMGLFLGDSSGAVVRLYNKSGAETGNFAEGSAGVPQLSFFDASHTERVYVGMSTADNPLFEAFDASHTLRSYMGAFNSGNYGMFINDSSGNTTWQEP